MTNDTTPSRAERVAAYNAEAFATLRAGLTLERIEAVIAQAQALKRALTKGDPETIRALGVGQARAERGFNEMRHLSGALRTVNAGNLSRVADEDAAAKRAEEEARSAEARAIAEREERRRRYEELRALEAEFGEESEA